MLTLEDIMPVIYNIIIAVIILVVGTIINRVLIKIIGRGLVKSHLTLQVFLINILKVILTAIVLVIALTFAGVPMNSIIAVIGSAGIAIGLAMKDSLSNVAAGVLILYGKIFNVGDYVEIDGTAGIISEIGIVYTKLTTPDGRGIFMPNTSVSDSVVVNFNSQTKRRLDINLKLSYNVDTDTAKALITGVLDADPRIIKDSGIYVRITDLTPSYQQISVRVYVPTHEYWDVNADTLEGIKKAFDNAKVGLFANEVELKQERIS
jgi:small conductance mechanosensitive channel